MNKCFNFLYLLTLTLHNLEEFVLEDKEICEKKTISILTFLLLALEG